MNGSPSLVVTGSLEIAVQDCLISSLPTRPAVERPGVGLTGTGRIMRRVNALIAVRRRTDKLRAKVVSVRSARCLVFSRLIRFHSDPVQPRFQRAPMRLSRFFLPILRETPNEAEVVSHRLMLRAGMMRQEAPARLARRAAQPSGHPRRLHAARRHHRADLHRPSFRRPHSAARHDRTQPRA